MEALWKRARSTPRRPDGVAVLWFRMMPALHVDQGPRDTFPSHRRARDATQGGRGHAHELDYYPCPASTPPARSDGTRPRHHRGRPPFASIV